MGVLVPFATALVVTSLAVMVHVPGVENQKGLENMEKVTVPDRRHSRFLTGHSSQCQPAIGKRRLSRMIYG